MFAAELRAFQSDLDVKAEPVDGTEQKHTSGGVKKEENASKKKKASTDKQNKKEEIDGDDAAGEEESEEYVPDVKQKSVKRSRK